jgi:hypothetical protein
MVRVEGHAVVSFAPTHGITPHNFVGSRIDDRENVIVLQIHVDFASDRIVHSLAVDPETHRVYAPEQEENGKPVARMVVYESVTNP